VKCVRMELTTLTSVSRAALSSMFHEGFYLFL
jgi:hypothetical protein